MKTLSIDIETYCDLDLKDVGVYRYASDPSFEIMLLAYSFDSDPVRIVDLAQGEKIPEEAIDAIMDGAIKKTAYNANFERVCISMYLYNTVPMFANTGFSCFDTDMLDPAQWECSMVKAGMLGLPMNLAAVGKVLKIENEKIEAGKALIRYFCKPCKPTKVNGGRVRNLPEHAPEKWEEFRGYCIQDVTAEQEVLDKISFFKTPGIETELYNLDQHINDTGIEVNMQLVRNAISIDRTLKKQLVIEAKEISELSNPNSPEQLKDWLWKETGKVITSLTKDMVKKLLEDGGLSDDAEKMLQIRQDMSKTSVKKYSKMEEAVCSDTRVRGLLQFYGANRTGRWAGRLVQVHNLTRNYINDLDLARELVLNNDAELIDMFYDSTQDILSQLVRTALVAPSGKVFVVSDFSAIEARVIAWLAGELWRLEVFNTHGRIYEASAAKMLRKDIEDVTKEDRFKGKVAELALGYQGGKNALLAMGALAMGLIEEELPQLVTSWRKANPKIKALWRITQDAAMRAITEGGIHSVFGKVHIYCKKKYLVIRLPSGRSLHYFNVGLGKNRFGGESITYYGMNQTTKKWQKMETYGGKLVENIVQAIARDCLSVSLLKIDKAGFRTVMHVHDEAVIENDIPSAEEDLKRVNAIMAEDIEWAPGLPLKGEGYVTPYYKKD